MNSTPATDLLCIGHITHDRIVTPAQPQGVDCAGGTVFYVAWALSRLPADVSFRVLTSVGSDLDGEVERLRKAGVSVESFRSAASVFFENRYGQNMDERQQRVLSKAQPFTIGQLEGVEARVFHLGTLLQDDFSPEVVEWLARRGHVCLDVQGFLREVRGQEVFPTEWADKERVLRHTHILKVNEQEAVTLTGTDELGEAARQMAAWGVKEVIVTKGSQGSTILADGRFTDIPAFYTPRAVDATGCGDTFTAGYLYARLRGDSIEKAGRLAAAMCTLKLEHTGPFEGTMEDINRLSSAQN